MNNKTYKKVLIASVITSLMLTIAHAVYVIYAYQNSSIIHFISKEWW